VGNVVAASGAAQGLAAVPGSATGGPPTGGAQGGELFDVADLGSLQVFVSVLAEVQIADAQHDSLLNTARGQFVPVVENDVIQMRPVNIGRDLGTQVYITAGPQDGDIVVVSPNDAVRQGAHVSTRPTPAGQQGGDADQEKQQGQAKPE
jgi:hypothetical protein